MPQLLIRLHRHNLPGVDHNMLGENSLLNTTSDKPKRLIHRQGLNRYIHNILNTTLAHPTEILSNKNCKHKKSKPGPISYTEFWKHKTSYFDNNKTPTVQRIVINNPYPKAID